MDGENGSVVAAKDLSLIPNTHIPASRSQLPVTPAAGDLTPLAFGGSCTRLDIPTHKQTHARDAKVHKQSFKTHAMQRCINKAVKHSRQLITSAQTCAFHYSLHFQENQYLGDAGQLALVRWHVCFLFTHFCLLTASEINHVFSGHHFCAWNKCTVSYIYACTCTHTIRKIG